MHDRPQAADTALSDASPQPMPRWPLVFVGIGGILGAAGVAVGAAGAHVGGGDTARISSEFLLVHAATLVATSGLALALRRTSAVLVCAMGLLAVGAVLFGGGLAFAALLDWRPVPLAAPTGGLCLIAGWLALATAGAILGLSRRRGHQPPPVLRIGPDRRGRRPVKRSTD